MPTKKTTKLKKELAETWEQYMERTHDDICTTPNCGKAIASKKKPKKASAKIRIIKPKNRIFYNETAQDISEACIICKNCKKAYIYNNSKNNNDYYENDRNNNEFYECPNCGTSNTVKQSKKLISNMSKNNETNKIKN